jgi:thiol-disulfide isomerase/thioredoxin
MFLNSLNLFSQKIWIYEDFKNQHVQSPDTVYVINFWATWCSPCVKELPAFEKNVQTFKDKPVQFYFLSLDFGGNAHEKANSFLDKNGYSFDSYLTTDKNANEWIPKVDKSWSGAIPATVIYKDQKKYFHEGTLTEETLKNQIQLMFN